MDSLLGILLVIAIVVVDSLQSKRRKKSQQNHLLPTEQPDLSALTEITPEEFIERMKKEWFGPFEASPHPDDADDPSVTEPVSKEDPPPGRAPEEKPPIETPARPSTQEDATAARLPSLEEAIELMKKQWLAPFEPTLNSNDTDTPSGTDPVLKQDPPPERAAEEKPPIETPARHSGIPIEEPGRPATLAHIGHDRAGHPLRQAPAAVRDLKEPSLPIGNDNPLATLKATPLPARRFGMKGRRLTRDDWRKGIIMAAIFGPPRGDQPYK